MRQVLIYLPLKDLSELLPDLPPVVFLILAGVVYGLRIFWERKSKEAGPPVSPVIRIAIGIVMGLLILAGIVKFLGSTTERVPIYGYGTMLFVSFVACILLASWLAEKEGISKTNMQDLAIWIFAFGIIGARITFMIQYWNHFGNLWQFFAIWDGGLVFYGSAIGGVVGYYLAYVFFLRKKNISTWKMADVIAPCAALGLCLGRVGCLLNGCCYGHVACPDCPAITFPLTSPARPEMVKRGYQTVAGFTLADALKPTVGAVDPNSPAAMVAQLKPGDVISKINDRPVDTDMDLARYFSPAVWGELWRGQGSVQFTVLRQDREVRLPAYTPRTIGLHPTQIYESISMFFLTLLLLSYFFVRRRDGTVMVLFMLSYALHRFLNEMLRTDTDKVAFDMTLSQNISLMVVVGGLALLVWVIRRPTREPLTA